MADPYAVSSSCIRPLDLLCPEFRRCPVYLYTLLILRHFTPESGKIAKIKDLSVQSGGPYGAQSVSYRTRMPEIMNIAATMEFVPDCLALSVCHIDPFFEKSLYFLGG